ncbi:uncharacterized protein LOC144707148 [Wolffia australiana]
MCAQVIPMDIQAKNGRKNLFIGREVEEKNVKKSYMLLSAVGRDGNNQMFPITWAVLEGENQASWTWFISLLMTNLGIVDGYGWTIISDQQKGLKNAVAGHLKFEVSTHGEGFVVDLHAQHCTCRYWAITGIPCPHSIACIHFIRADPANYVNEWLKRDSYQLAYSYGIWGENEGSYLFPPLAKKQPGRPKHRRRTDVSEAGPSGLRLTKKGVQMHCSLCNQGGHNRKTCGNRRLQPACEGSQSSSGGFSKLLKSMTKFQG